MARKPAPPAIELKSATLEAMRALLRSDDARAIADALDLTDAEIVRLAENSFTGSFLPMADQIQHLAEIAEVAGGR